MHISKEVKSFFDLAWVGTVEADAGLKTEKREKQEISSPVLCTWCLVGVLSH